MAAGRVRPLKRITVARSHEEIAFARFFGGISKLANSLDGRIAEEKVVVHPAPFLAAGADELLFAALIPLVLGNSKRIEVDTPIEPCRTKCDDVVSIPGACPIAELFPRCG